MPFPETNAQPELLVSESNPGGWQFDALLAHVRSEFEHQLLRLDPRDDQVKQKLAGYEAVITALWEAEGRYRALGPHRTRV